MISVHPMTRVDWLRNQSRNVNYPRTGGTAERNASGLQWSKKTETNTKHARETMKTDQLAVGKSMDPKKDLNIFTSLLIQNEFVEFFKQKIVFCGESVTYYATFLIICNSETNRPKRRGQYANNYTAETQRKSNRYF